MSGQGAFVLKLNPQGDLIWVDNFIGQIYGVHVTSSSDGSIFWSCSFTNAVDIDPGPLNIGIFTPTHAVCLLRLKPDGALQWFKKWDVGNNLAISSISIAKDGNLIFSGSFIGQYDLDPGPGVATIASAPNNVDVFICQFTTGGSFQWVKQITGTAAISTAYIGDLKIDQNGNIILGTTIQGTKDLDPGPAVLEVTGYFDDVFLIKLDAAGNLLWARQVWGDKNQQVYGIDVDESGDIYAIGTFEETADFDPGPGEVLLDTGNFFKSTFVLKLDFLGNFQWVRQISGYNFGAYIAVSADHRVFAAGGFQGTATLNAQNPQVSYTAVSETDMFLLRIDQPHHYSGKVFHDINENGVPDAGEPGLTGVSIQAKNLDKYATTGTNGDFHFYDNLAGDTVQVVAPWPGTTIQPAFIIPDSTQPPMLFAATFAAGDSLLDACIAAVEVTPFRPGFVTTVSIQVSNVGTVPLLQVPVKLRIIRPDNPNLLSFINASPSPAAQTTDNYEWMLDAIFPGQTVDIRVYFLVSTSIALNADILLSTSVILDEDANPFNNGSRIETVTIGSYDPNDKQVTPPAVALAAIDTTNLRYVIRFQNTGTYPADFVVIRDTLPAELDLSTLKVLAASHPFSWRLFGARVLEFRFDPIHLPDSTSNEPESHGFVMFTAQANPGLPLGTVIHNRAGIYFDYNEPVITNYAEMRVGTAVSAHTPESIPDFDLIPNPTSAGSGTQLWLKENLKATVEVRVFDSTGRIVLTKELASGEKELVLNNLPAGAYFVQLRAGGRIGGSVLIVK